MTCSDCEQAQNEGLVAYFRVWKANVGITGCRFHVGAVMQVLRKHLEELNNIANHETKNNESKPVEANE